MPRDFYPRPEADILRWTSNFRARIVAEGGTLGLNPGQIAAYVQAQDRFAIAYAAAHSPTQRTPSIMQAKDAARIALEAQSRMLAAMIGAQPGLTPTMRCRLGLAMRGRGGYRRALPPPAEPPRLHVRSIEGRIATLMLSDRESGRRRKPRGANSAVLWSYVGDAPPADMGKWKFAGHTSRTLTRVAFNAEPGTRVWLSVCWQSHVGKLGRPCEPVMMHVGGGGPMMMPQSLKAARMLCVPALPVVTETVAEGLAKAA